MVEFAEDFQSMPEITVAHQPSSMKLACFLADRTMEYISVKQFAEKFNVSERTARNYCAGVKIDGARLVGKSWNVPADAVLPGRKKKAKTSPLLSALQNVYRLELSLSSSPMN